MLEFLVLTRLNCSSWEQEELFIYISIKSSKYNRKVYKIAYSPIGLPASLLISPNIGNLTPICLLSIVIGPTEKLLHRPRNSTPVIPGLDIQRREGNEFYFLYSPEDIQVKRSVQYYNGRFRLGKSGPITIPNGSQLQSERMVYNAWNVESMSSCSLSVLQAFNHGYSKSSLSILQVGSDQYLYFSFHSKIREISLQNAFLFNIVFFHDRPCA